MTEVTTLNFLLLTVSGWVNRRQLKVIEYLREENRVLREHLGTNQGLGIAVIPMGFVREELAQGKVERVLERIVGRSTALQLVYPTGRHLAAKVRAFIDFAVEHIKEHPISMG